VNQNTPRDYYNTNPLGSDFAAAQGLTTTWGLTPDLDPRIIQIIPEEFGAFKWYSQSAKKSSTGKEFNWLMAQYPNRPAQVKAPVERAYLSHRSSPWRTSASPLSPSA
jgi:hypothetical protein